MKEDLGTELDLLRKDLVYQLYTADEIDWDYFVETANKAKYEADKEGRNMKEDLLIKKDTINE